MRVALSVESPFCVAGASVKSEPFGSDAQYERTQDDDGEAAELLARIVVMAVGAGKIELALPLLEEFFAVRAATMVLLRGLDEAAWRRCGTANGMPASGGDGAS